MDAVLCIAMDGGINMNMINFIMNDLMELLPNNVAVRRRDRKIRNQNYFEYVIPRYTDVQFAEHFRVCNHRGQFIDCYIGMPGRVCNHRGQFIDCYIGMPGRMHDTRVFRQSLLFECITNARNPLIPKNFHLIGDTAYPLLINLMTPFKDNGHLTVPQIRYNQKLSSIRSIIERAFALLKGKFRRLKYLDIADFELGNKMIATACTLHNFIIDVDDINVEFEDFENLNEHVNEERNAEGAEVLEAVEKRLRLVHEM